AGDRMRLRRVRAHEDQGLRIADVVVGIRLRAVAPGVGHARHRRRMADAGLVVDVVGAPEGRELAEEVGTLVRELGRAEQVDGVGAVALADLHHLVADLVDGLLPGDALPLAAGQFHRVFQPPVAVRDLAHGGTLDAVAAAVDRAVPDRFLPDPDAVLHLRTNRAADGAV